MFDIIRHFWNKIAIVLFKDLYEIPVHYDAFHFPDQSMCLFHNFCENSLTGPSPFVRLIYSEIAQRVFDIRGRDGFIFERVLQNFNFPHVCKAETFRRIGNDRELANIQRFSNLLKRGNLSR